MMKNWILTCSTDGVDIDFEITIQSKTEPDFWTCYNKAMKHGCPFFTITEDINYQGGLIMFEYAGYKEDKIGGLLIYFTKDGKTYSMYDSYDDMWEAGREAKEQLNDEQFDQWWNDEGEDYTIKAWAEEVAYYLNDGEWNTDDLILED